MFWKKQLKIFSKLFIPLGLLVATTIFGIIGFSIIEHYTFLESLYITIITISTVGYGEIRPLSDAGRIFTIILILLNLGIVSYFIALISRFFLDGDFIKSYKLLKMEHNIQQLKDHVIICGFGRNGKETAQVLHDNNIPFVVLEKEELNKQVNFKVGHLMYADATSDESLLHAGIKKAKAIITTLPLDTDNLFVVLTSRQLNRGIRIISRASKDSSVDKLKIAGADNVIMPDKIGGAHMATLVMIPDVVEVLSLMSTRNNAEFKVVEMPTQKSFVLQDADLWKKSGCTILAIKTVDGTYKLNPSFSCIINNGECLIVMGSEEQISKARELV